MDPDPDFSDLIRNLLADPDPDQKKSLIRIRRKGPGFKTLEIMLG